MTVFEGVCDQVRESSHWSAHLPLDLPVEQVTATFIEALRAVEATVGFDMVIDQVYNSEVGGTLLRLKPANARTEQALHALREQLSALTGIRQPVHDSYHFHITLSYKLVHLSSAQEAEVAAVCQVIEQRLRERFGVLRHSAVEFCEFDDMFQFTPRLMLPLVA